MTSHNDGQLIRIFRFWRIIGGKVRKSPFRQSFYVRIFRSFDGEIGGDFELRYVEVFSSEKMLFRSRYHSHFSYILCILLA